MAAWVTVSIPEGSTLGRTWQLTSGGSPLNLTGVTVTAVVKPSERYADNHSRAYRLTEGSGVTITDAAAGKVKITLPAEVTNTPSTWFYKIIATVGGQGEPAIMGWITITDT